PVTDRAGLEQAWQVRTEVFVHEQQVPPAEEIDALDTAETTSHVLAVDGEGTAVGTARLLSEPDHPGEVHLGRLAVRAPARGRGIGARLRSEEHTSELQSRENLVCRLLLEKKKKQKMYRKHKHRCTR